MEFLSKLFPQSKTPLLFAAFIALVVAYLLKDSIGSAIQNDNTLLSTLLGFVFFFFIILAGIALFANMANKETASETSRNTNTNVVQVSKKTKIKTKGKGHSNTVIDSEDTEISGDADEEDKKKA